MRDCSSRTRKAASYAALAAVALLLLSPGVSFTARAEDIPHENYDLVGSDLNVVISILNSTIHYSELALTSMYYTNMPYVQQNLTIVRGLLTPASEILSRIKDVAGSYTNLSMLLPPFISLSSQMDSFATMEVSLLESRDTIVTASQLAGLTGEEMLEALRAIERFNSLVLQMNSTIDDMLVSANNIIALEVDGERPFTDNQLILLIERLRELLQRIEAEIDIITHDEVPWTKTQPFLLFWLSASSYYLGDTIVGGGYLYFNGSFASGYDVDIRLNGNNLTTARTTAGGRYAFAYQIPVNASWLGTHAVQAFSSTPVGILSSSTLTIRVLLIPTTTSLSISADLMTVVDQLRASVSLKEVHGLPVGNASGHFILDGVPINFTADSAGTFSETWPASSFGFGSHSIQAFHDAELPYAPSSSAVREFVVNIPTHIDFRLFQQRFLAGQYVLGNGTLFANSSTPLTGQRITLSVDGVTVANATTDSIGEFAFTISSDNMTFGGHVLRAEFLHGGVIWRYSYNETGFDVYGRKTGGYPFFPFLPRWGDLFSPDTIPYLFIGPNAYFFWLLLLVLVGMTVKTLQMRKAKLDRARRARTEVMEALDKAALELPIAPISAEELVAELEKMGEVAKTPNERIVLYYQRLLAFLTRRARVSIRPSMTHWEVARLLKSLGYPSSPIERATILFERAFYSGTHMTDDDTVRMSSALTTLVGKRGLEVADAS